MSAIQKKITKDEFVEVVLNNTDRKTNVELSKMLGISETHFYRLQKEYAIRSKDEVKKYAQLYTAELMQMLRSNAKKGSDRAIQLLLEMGESYTPSNKLDMKATLSIEYNIGTVKTPMDAGLSPVNKLETGEQKLIK